MRSAKKSITMKNRAINLIVVLIASAGIGIYNYTDEDIVFESGEVIEATIQPKHLTKVFGNRDVSKIKYITHHHTAGPKTQSIESIAKDQIKRGFAEFAYHFAIYEDGSLYAVNDLEEVSWHDSGQNTNSIGIVFVGNYENYPLSEAALNTAKELDNAICQVLNIQGIRGHRDTSPTLCPGTFAYNQLKDVFF